jgi:hypothetical protein
MREMVKLFNFVQVLRRKLSAGPRLLARVIRRGGLLSVIVGMPIAQSYIEQCLMGKDAAVKPQKTLPAKAADAEICIVFGKWE